MKEIAETPLVGKRVLLLRPQGVVSQLEVGLQQLGAVVETIALTQVVPLPVASSSVVTQADWVLFTSQQGVLHGWQYLPDPYPNIAVVGQATQVAVERQGGVVSFCAKRASAKGLVTELLVEWQQQGITQPQQILWLGSALAQQPTIVSPFTRAGHTVACVPVYTTQPLGVSAGQLAELQQQINEFSPDAVVLTSASGVEALANAGLQLGVTCTLVSLGANTTSSILAFDWACGFVEVLEPTPWGIATALTNNC